LFTLALRLVGRLVLVRCLNWLVREGIFFSTFFWVRLGVLSHLLAAFIVCLVL
jgi:hypothetical protein